MRVRAVTVWEALVARALELEPELGPRLDRLGEAGRGVCAGGCGRAK